MEIDNFRSIRDPNTGDWELWRGDSLPEMRDGVRYLRSAQVNTPTPQHEALLLERLNGFPKAIEFLFKLRDHLDGSKIDREKRIGEHITEFLEAVPYQHSLLEQEEPKPREFNVTISRTIKATVNVVATTPEEAAELVWERGDQIGEAFEMTASTEGDEAYEETVVKVEENKETEE